MRYTAVLLPDRRPPAYFGIVRDPTAVTDSVTSGLVPDGGLACSTAETIRLVPPEKSLTLIFDHKNTIRMYFIHVFKHHRFYLSVN